MIFLALVLVALLDGPDAIDDLGDSYPWVREAASLRLEVRAVSDRPLRLALASAARNHPDPEVRFRAQVILRRIYTCKNCRGFGGVEVREWNHAEWACCRRCMGIGSDWFAVLADGRHL